MTATLLVSTTAAAIAPPMADATPITAASANTVPRMPRRTSSSAAAMSLAVISDFALNVMGWSRPRVASRRAPSAGSTLRMSRLSAVTVARVA